MLLTKSIKDSFELVLETQAKIEQLQELLKNEKAKIKKFLDENNMSKLEQNGYYALANEACRDTLQANEVAKLLGYDIPDSCYKHTQYTTLTIKRITMV